MLPGATIPQSLAISDPFTKDLLPSQHFTLYEVANSCVNNNHAQLSTGVIAVLSGDLYTYQIAGFSSSQDPTNP